MPLITTLGMHRDRKLLREIGCIFKVETRGFAKEFDIGPERKKNQKQFKDTLVISGKLGILISSSIGALNLGENFRIWRGKCDGKEDMKLKGVFSLP